MYAFGYTPKQIAEMTLEQQLLGLSDPDSTDSKIVHCKNLGEARRFIEEIKRSKLA